MSNEQKLREALRIAVNYIDMDALYTFAGCDHDTIKEALATTEPELTGMPELPEPVANVSASSPVGGIGFVKPDKSYFTEDQTRAYGEQCWKAGYKHGAWGDKPEPTSKQSLQVEPAVNQQLTTEPFDEREAFEKWITKNGEWPNNAVRSCLDPDRYANFDIQGLWEAWQARAAMAKGVK